jgi:SGNH hydrolase-like domain, acetyltransferase AlgX
LAVCFLVIIFGVPITQVCIQLSRGERVQFTDLFRYAPTEKNLRQFEQTLKDQSWFEQKLRPWMQLFLLRTVRETGAKAIMGRDGWLFYRPDVRYAVEPDRPNGGGSEGSWVQLAEGTQQDSVVRAIVRFRDQLKERGIELLVMPVPGKPSVYPEMLRRSAGGKDFYSPTVGFMQKLQRQGVEVVDLVTLFHRVRDAEQAGDPYYLARDTHWTPKGAELAAEAVAQRLRSLGWAPQPTMQFRTRKVRVKRYGDILEMIEPRGTPAFFPAEEVQCDQVVDDTGGLLAASDSERPGTYRFPGAGTSVLVLGDSFCRIYQNREPQSLGEILGPTSNRESGGGREGKTSTRLLPGSAGFPSHLALALRAPLDFIVSDGGASTDVRRSLSTNPEILEGKKVVVWEFVERDIQLGMAGWRDVPLPP